MQNKTGKKFQNSCTEFNIKPNYARLNNHWAVGFVERHIQTIKRHLPYMEALLIKSFIYNMQHKQSYKN